MIDRRKGRPLMGGMYRRIGAGTCALLLGLALSGCDAPVDVGTMLDSLLSSEAPSRGEEGSSLLEKETPTPSSPAAASSHREEDRGEEEHQQSGGEHHRQTPAPQAGSAAPDEEGALLTEAQAKERALAHAQLSAGEVTFTKVKLDWEDGRQVYEIEFVTKDWTEYEFEIDAQTGDVLKWGREQEAPPAAAKPTPKPAPEPTPEPAQEPAGIISPEEAKSIALGRVPGASAGNITKFETDYDDGRTVYEGEIVFGENEYEFEIDGATGAVLEWDVESIFD